MRLKIKSRNLESFCRRLQQRPKKEQDEKRKSSIRNTYAQPGAIASGSFIFLRSFGRKGRTFLGFCSVPENHTCTGIEHDNMEKVQRRKNMAVKNGMVGIGVKCRITGYLVGTTDRFNNAKRAEEHDRVRHSVMPEGREGHC